MGGPQWIKRRHDPYLRDVVAAEIVQSMSIRDRLFALTLSCGHTGYMSHGKHRSDFAPKTHRCKRCMQDAIGDHPQQPKRPTPAEAAIAGYVGGMPVGVMAAARAAMALEEVGAGGTALQSIKSIQERA